MRNELSLPRRQRGIALIVTLVILTIVTFMGLIAMRAGLMQVTMSTNSQVSTVLFQNADSGTGSIESKVNLDPEYANGPTGPITLVKDNPGTEITGCLKKGTAGLVMATTAAAPVRCDPTQTADYMSGRGAVVVQVTIKTPVDKSGKAQVVQEYGTDDSVLPGGGSALIAAYSTSVMPAFGSATTSSIKTCLEKPQEGTDTVTSCLSTEKASFQTVVQEFVYGYAGYK